MNNKDTSGSFGSEGNIRYYNWRVREVIVGNLKKGVGLKRWFRSGKWESN